MEEISNDIVDFSHHDQLRKMRFSPDLPQVMGTNDSRISNQGC